MADSTARDRAVTRQRRPRMSVTVEAKIMKPCLDPDLEIGARAAVAKNAGIEPPSIGIVMVADQTVDGRVFSMVEVQGQRLRTRQQRFTQRDECAARNERT